MAGNIQSRLAELAAALVSESPFASRTQFSPASPESETDAEWQARLERRAARIARGAATWDKDELVDRYAWLLLLALEMRKTAKLNKQTIDGLFIALKRDRAAIEALQTMESAYTERMELKLAKYRQDRQRAAAARLAKDPKQAAKAKALELWKQRHAGECPKLRTVEQYAAEVMRRWPELTSAKVICGWSATWTKAVKEGKTPAC